ncbi:MAG: hypothetical protein AAGA95_11100 [Pseudomonadota bacterium]
MTSLLLMGASVLVLPASANEANLTRFGPITLERGPGKAVPYTASFKAIEGPGELVLSDDGIRQAWIRINGQQIARGKMFRAEGDFIVPIHLYAENTIEGFRRWQVGTNIDTMPGAQSWDDQERNMLAHDRAQADWFYGFLDTFLAGATS